MAQTPVGSIDPTTVVGYVNVLLPALETGLQLYTRWKKRNGRENHYHKQARGSQAAASNCALSTSLRISASKIKETYDVGFSILGSEFSTGDNLSRGCLGTQWHLIKSRISLLQTATETTSGGPLDLNDIFQTSEAVRISSVRALSELYSRLAIGRPLPREIPIPKSRSSSRQSNEPLPAVPRYLEDDKDTAIWSTTSPVPNFQSEPPSPPRTPELVIDDVESAYGGPSEAGGAAGTTRLRPKNSVFSIFCAEAMALQVDVTRPIPSRRKCKCGYRWKLPELADANEALLLKDGFRITRRFLAKSHCEQDDDGRDGTKNGGYGCVLCTSSGRTETYETAEQLRVHINLAHTKWQMLHDRDMT